MSRARSNSSVRGPSPVREEGVSKGKKRRERERENGFTEGYVGIR